MQTQLWQQRSRHFAKTDGYLVTVLAEVGQRPVRDSSLHPIKVYKAGSRRIANLAEFGKEMVLGTFQRAHRYQGYDYMVFYPFLGSPS